MSREAIVILILKRGWQLWQADFEACLKKERWSRMKGLPNVEEWERFRAGVSPSGYIEEIKNGVWFAS